MGVTRREVVGGVIAGMSLPVLQGMLGVEPTVLANDGEWVKTVKPTDLADGGFQRVEGQPIFLARQANEIYALNNKCTHKACAVNPLRRKKGVMQCPCHNAEYDIQGNVTKGPAEKPLARHALRLNADGIIEVSAKRLDDVADKSGVLEVK